jgi:CheY-like chemotaxis protein
MHMPAFDGVQTAKALRDDPHTSSIPLVLLSSSGFNPEQLEAASLFAAVLFKPIRSSPLYNAMAHVTGGAVPVAPVEDSFAFGGEEPRLRGMRVLVVEDNPVNQMVATEYLESWGCEHVTADNGAAAVALYREDSFDVVLMDVQMPIMDGFEATAEIRRIEEAGGGHVPIIAMTANAMSGDRERCLRAGMDGYLSKPLQPRVLKERLTELAAEDREVKIEMSDETMGGAPLFDPQRLDETCAGKASLKLRVIERYVATAGASASAIDAAVAAADVPGVAAAAHALKGSRLTIGSPLLSAMCERVEHAAREGAIDSDTAGQIRPSLERLQRALEDYAQELRSAV